MVLSELLASLRKDGLDVTASRIHYAIATGKISKPRLDGSLAFDFDEANLRELRRYFKKRKKTVAVKA